MAKKLVIVESPSKSHTIGQYLGKNYLVTSSKGHIRDLAKTGKGRLGVDVENDYKPKYVVSADKKDTVKALKDALKKCDEVYLATDPDREGEAISWHLAEVLGLDVDTTHRVEFHEVTKNAIMNAMANPRTIDMEMVHSQETRRVLDRIIGFKLSTLLQRKIKSKSAGRVQSVALKLIVDREREIEAFIPDEYWEIEASFNKDNIDFDAKLSKYNGKKVKITNGQQASDILNALSPEFNVTEVKTTRKKRESKPPFITSTLQQEASTKLSMAARRTMSVAQSLYEGKNIGSETVGLITYMRTDSVRLSSQFIDEAEDYIEQTYGASYKGKAKRQKNNDNVQDAHEGIRPTSIWRTPESIERYLTKDEFKLYRLIYNRALASVMAPAAFDSTSVRLDNHGYEFNASGQVQVFDGYLKVYGDFEKSNDARLPELSQNEVLTSTKIEKSQHFTEPPARYTEAKLIREMEELGIGRPSTYASIIDTITSRDYVEVKEKRFYPTQTGILTNDKLAEYFSSIINVAYTANMEKQLDEIALGNETYVHALSEFEEAFEPLLEKAYDGMEKVAPQETGETCPECGSPLVIRKGRYGEFVSCSNYPECKFIKKEASPEPEETGETCPECGSPMVKRMGRYGPFDACSNYPTCKYIKKTEKKKVQAKEVDGMTCPNCGGKVVMRRGRYGNFMACSNYPACKTIIKKDKGDK